MAEVYALDLDEEFLSHLAIPESISEIWNEDISDELIADEFVRQVYHWQFEHLREEGKPATASVLAEEFDLDIEEPLTAIGDLIERLRARYVRNNARKYMEKLADAYKEDPAKVIEVLPKVSREIIEVVGARGEAFGTGDFDRAMSRYDEAVLRGPGPSTGFKELDGHFHGMRGLSFTLAPPKTYKSWLEVNRLFGNIKAGRNMWLYSLELPAEETDMRIRCMAADVPYWRYLHGSLRKTDRDALREASELLDDLGVYRIVKPAIGHRSIEEMVERAGEAGADGIIVDQLQYIETRDGKHLGGCEPREYWQPLNMARDLSDKMPIEIAHQFNRSVMFSDKMPEMQQAKGSAAVEETATLILGAWANKDMRRSNLIEVGVVAARNYTFESWEIGVELTNGCNFECLGVVVHDD